MSSQPNSDPDKIQAPQATLFDRIFRDSEGNIVIAQPPNLPMLVAIAATLLRFAITTGQIHALFNLIAFGAWFTWAWEELFDGVNYFRRGLGAVSLAALLSLALNLSGT